MNIEHKRVNAGRLELHVAELGVGPPVLLLHGFPADWSDWRSQMEVLAANGFRAIAPDLPGYGQSDQLPLLMDYRSALLASDLAGLIGALGLTKVHVIGHDWGGTLAYCLASQHPELVNKLIVLNAGHPLLLQRALRHFDQLRRSWYVFLFQLPWLAEWLVQRPVAMTLALREMEVRPGAFSDADLARYRVAIRLPGAARAALRYYRAAFRAPMRAKRPVQQSTLVLWGDRDQALSGRLLLTDLAQHVPRVRVQRFADAGHWVHRDVPALVSQHLLDFLSTVT